MSGIATPPATETDRALDDSSEPDTISVADSQDLGSDFDEPDTHIRRQRSGLSVVAELSDVDERDDVEGQRRALAGLVLQRKERSLESAEEDADVESDDAAGDGQLVTGVASLNIRDEDAAHTIELTNALTPRPRERLGLWDRRQGLARRAPSSPSASPSPIQREVKFQNRLRTRRATAQEALTRVTLFDFVYG